MRYPVLRFIYRIFLHLLPRDLRSTHAKEMERLFAETIELEANRRGWYAFPSVFVCAAADILRWCAATRFGAGGLERTRNEERGGVLGNVAGLGRDFFHAIRSFRKRPSFFLVATLTLAIGLGSVIAIFSVVDVVLLRPLPYPQPSQIYTLWETNLERGRTWSLVAPPTFVDWRDNADSFTEMTAISSSSVTLTGGSQPERISAIWASPNIFALLGVRMYRGRIFPPEADLSDGGNLVVVSYGFWQRWLGEDPEAVGTTLVLDGEAFSVVGVLPQAFRFPEKADLWLPLSFVPDELSEGMRGARYLQVIGRVRPGVTIERARAEMAGIADALGESHPNNARWSVSLVPLHENMVSDFRHSLTLLLFATGLVLVIAGVNVVNLVLARASDQRCESAVRMALGATRARLFRESLVQHIMLAISGGVVGAIAAAWSVAPLVRFAPAEIPRIEDVAIDSRVVAVCLVLSVLVGLVLSVVSLGSGERSDPRLTLRAAQLGGTSTRHRVRRALIVAEVALSVVLLIGAGLLIRSFWKLQQVDPGFSTSGVTAISISLSGGRYSARTQQSTFFREFVERLSKHAQIQSVGATTNLPLSGSAMSFGYGIDDQPAVGLNEQLSAEYHAVTPGYFRTMGIELRSGREFVWQDDSDGIPVVIINEMFALRHWPDDDPIGRQITVVSQSGPVSREIVGVVANVKHAGLATLPRAEVYVPLPQDPWTFATIVVNSVEGAPVVRLVRSELGALDAAMPLGTVVPIEQHVSRWLAPLRFQMLLVGLFATVALLLASLGIYGVIAYLVSLRTNEIGVRMALGALSCHVLGSVVGEGVILAAVGASLGVAASLWVTRYLASLLFEVSTIDPGVFIVAAILVLSVAVLASIVPACRAVRVDPIEALREV